MRTLRVYDSRNGDFTIDVPDDAKVTFGYFNPAVSKDGYDNRYQHNPNVKNVAKQTALRIYTGKTERTSQMACFLGVDGFRDEALNFTKVDQTVAQVRFKNENGQFTPVSTPTGYN